MADELLRPDQYDQSGFLVGPSTEDDIDKAGREIEILRAIHEDTQESISLLSRIADGIGAQSFAPPPDTAAPTVAGKEQEGAQNAQALHAAPAEPGALAGAPTEPAADVATPAPVIMSDGEAVMGAGQVMPLAPVVNQAAPNPAMALVTPAAAPTPAITPASAAPAVTPVPAAPAGSVAPAAVAAPATPAAAPPTAAPAPVPLAPAVPAEPRARAENGQFKTALPPTVKPAIADEGVASAERAERNRQTNGRFGADGADGDGAADAGESKTSKAMGAASESLKSAAEGISSSADNIDPTVQAAKEVAGIVSPVIGVVKPLAGLFGMRKSTPEEKSRRTNAMWFRRIWNTLKADKGGSSRMGLVLAGLASMLGLLLAPIKALARMTGAMRALAGLGALLKGVGALRRRGGVEVPRRRAATNAPHGDARRSKGAPIEARTRTHRAGHPDSPSANTPKAKDAAARPSAPGAPGTAASKPGAKPEAKPASTATPEAKGGAKPDAKPATAKASAPAEPGVKTRSAGSAITRGAKGVLSKIPLIGALVGAGLFASAALAKGDPGATPEQSQADKTERYGTMGGVAGGMLGGVLGMFGGPAGAIAGGLLGDQVGTAVGEWLSTVDMNGMMNGITSAWQTVADGANKMAADAFGTMKDGWNSLVTVGTGAFTSMTDWAKDTWKSATDKVMAFKDSVDDTVQSARDYVGGKASSIMDAGQNALSTVTGGRYTGGSNARKDELIKAMDAGGITDPKSKAAFMANVDHESGGFKRSEENLNYSAARLQEVFPKYYKNAESARADARNPEAIANKVYGGRMGNVEPGDGYKFRGRGDIQLTGRAQYEKMGKKLGIDLVNNPDLASDPQYRSKIAVQHWKDSGANAAAARGDITGARVRTNGGTNGLADVSAKYDQYLVQAQAGDLTPTRRADQVQVAAPAAATGAIATTLAALKGTGKGGVPASSAPGAQIIPGVAGAASAPGSPGMAGRPGISPMAGTGGSGGAGGAPGMAGAPGVATVFGANVPGVTVAAGAAVPAAPAGVSPIGGDAGRAPATLKPQPLGMMLTPNMAMPPVTVAAPALATPVAPTALKMASVEPIALPAPKMPTYAPPAADASLVKLPSTPQVTKPLMGAGNNKPTPPAAAPMILNQDMEDRRIAHAATGGLGGSSMGRM